MTPLVPLDQPDQKTWNRLARTAINAMAQRLTQQGATAKRPAQPVVGQSYYDETLGIPIWYHATGVWKNAAGTTV